MRKLIAILLTLFFICLLAFSGYKIYGTYSEKKQAKDINNHIIANAVSTKSPMSEKSQDSNIQDSTATPVLSLEESITVPITIDFDKLREINSDVVGWIYCEGTVINYPVVQGTDNQYYVYHLFNKKQNNSGAIFMDYRCSLDYADNTILYGHHMKNGSMFASIVRYRSQSYYDNHPVMFFITPDKNYLVELFSSYVTKSKSQSFNISFSTDKEFDDFISSTIKKSNFVSNIDVTSESQIITLSTCTYDYDNARYVVHGKLKEID